MPPASTPETRPAFLDAVNWNADGLVPAIVQDVETHEVLMMAWMNQTALLKTFQTGLTHFHSRSRGRQWLKGETSGHVQHVESIHVDCDADVVLIRARQVGGACHEGYRSCFFRKVSSEGGLEIVGLPVFDAGTVYSDSKPSVPSAD